MRRPPLPRRWLMTDERMGAALLPAIARLPRGTGIVFRHHATPAPERRRLFGAVRRIARARRLALVLAGGPREAIAWRADGAHGRSPHRPAARRLIRTAPAHDSAELIRAARAGADLAFVSPVFATRSHPGAATLGAAGFGLVAGRGGAGRGFPRIVALGGMDARRFRRLRALGAYGWAGIDAFMPWRAASP